jgi:cytochrome P450
MDLTRRPSLGERADAVRVTSPDAVRDALLDDRLVPDTTLALQLVGQDSGVTIFLAERGEEHDRRRRSVARAMGPRAVRLWEPYIRDIARGLAHQCGTGDSLAAGADFARPLAALAAGAFIGLPRDRSPELVSLASDVVALDTRPNRRTLSAVKVLRLAQQALDDEQGRRRATEGEGMPTSVLDRLLVSGVDTADILGLMMPLLTVGVELGARALLTVILGQLPHSDSTEGHNRLSDAEIDGLIAHAAILPMVTRVAERATRIGEHALSAGDKVELVVAGQAAPGQGALLFGTGARYCLGAAWVRAIARTGAVTFLQSFPNIAVRRVEMAPPGLQIGGPVEVKVDVL